MSRSSQTVAAGFIPLMDFAPLAVAVEAGFAAAEGLDLTVVRETSWATIRDRLAVGQLDVAHILAPMPIAANLGLTPLPSSLIVAMALGHGGNTVTVSNELWQALAACGATGDFDARHAAHAMAATVAARRAAGQPKLVFGIVHAFSVHHYELAYWLAYAGIRAGRVIELVVLPPSLMGAALAAGQIDAFCAGEPWGSLAVASGSGVIVTTNKSIWRSSPEKVLGVRREWAEEDPQRLAQLVRAIYRACVWCDDSENRSALAAILAQPAYLGQPVDLLEQVLARKLLAPNGGRLPVDGFLSFAAKAATFPWLSQAMWLYSQMVRWGQVDFSAANGRTVLQTYRPDLYRAALSPLNVPVPAANARVEGALAQETPVGSPGGTLWLGPDGFFDGQVFDLEQIEAYIGLQRSADG